MKKLVMLIAVLCVTHVYVGILGYVWNNWESFHFSLRPLNWLFNTGYVLYIFLPALSIVYTLSILAFLEALFEKKERVYKTSKSTMSLDNLERFPNQD